MLLHIRCFGSFLRAAQLSRHSKGSAVYRFEESIAKRLTKLTTHFSESNACHSLHRAPNVILGRPPHAILDSYSFAWRYRARWKPTCSGSRRRVLREAIDIGGGGRKLMSMFYEAP